MKKLIGTGMALALMSGGAMANTIDVISRSSTIHVAERDAELPYNVSLDDGTSGFGVYDSSVTLPYFDETATQYSAITENAIHYQDFVSIVGTNYHLGSNEASSVFSVTFNVPTATQFSLDWSVVGIGQATFTQNPRSPSISITGPGGAAAFYFVWSYDNQVGNFPIGPLGAWAPCNFNAGNCPYVPFGSTSGTIAAGQYTLEIATALGSNLGRGGTAGAPGSSATTFNLVLEPVPIPGAVWMMGSALVGLAGVARRRKSA